MLVLVNCKEGEEEEGEEEKEEEGRDPTGTRLEALGSSPPPALHRPFSAAPTVVGDAAAPRQSPVMFRRTGRKSKCPDL